MTYGAPPAEGLRERKKQLTRSTIVEAALELFERQGFTDTTIPQIAAAADVSPRTVSAYFPAKEDLVFPDGTQTMERLAARLDERRAGETAADAIRDWITTLLPEWDARDEELRRQRRVIAAEPLLGAYEQRFRAEGERLIAQAIAVDLGASAADLEPRMAAAATFAIFSVLGEHGEGGDGESTCTVPVDRAVLIELLERALRFVDAGIRAWRADAPAAVAPLGP